LGGLVCLTVAACDIHDNNIQGTLNIDDVNLGLDFDGSFDRDAVKPGDSIPIVITPRTCSRSPRATPLQPTRSPGPGTFRSTSMAPITPLLITAEATVNITIPQQTAPGPPKLICRAHHHDGTPTSVSVEIAFTITATAA
jgi:hypothetical protein